jgi:hypothetical protein
MSSNIKPKTGGLAAILRLEKERLAQEEKERQQDREAQLTPAENTPAVESAAASNITPPAFSTPPTGFIAPMDFTAGAIHAGQPPQNEPTKESAAPAKSKGAILLPVDAPHLRTPHEITDRILPTLKPGCQVVLMRLYRLSAGFGSNTCHVSIPKLASACNISETQIRIFLRDLEQRKLIKRLSVDLANKIQSERGITFEVLLPRLAATKTVAGLRITGGANPTGGAISEPNKINTQKEITQTQEPSAGVRAGSKFTIEECRRYAEHLRSTGQGINNPGGYATTIHRTGEADELIESFIRPAQASQVDASECPDCKGSGFYYPEGPAGGVAKCRHEKLKGGSGETYLSELKGG